MYLRFFVLWLYQAEFEEENHRGKRVSFVFCQERWTPPRRRGSGTGMAPLVLCKEATRGTLRRVSRCL